MSGEYVLVDVSNMPDLIEEVDKALYDGNSVLLMVDNDELALVVSPTDERHRPRRREITDEEWEAFLATAGSWKDLVDVEAFQRANEESRSLPPRPLIEP